MKPSTEHQCVPDLIPIPERKDLPAELLLEHRCPVVPVDGSENEALISWAEICAAFGKIVNDNVARIRELQER